MCVRVCVWQRGNERTTKKVERDNKNKIFLKKRVSEQMNIVCFYEPLIVNGEITDAQAQKDTKKVEI